MSCQPCGCDAEAGHTCERHILEALLPIRDVQERSRPNKGGTRAARNAQGYKQCPTCQQFYPETNFHQSNRRAGWLAADGSYKQSRCKGCQVNDRRKARATRTAKLGRLKLQTGCVDCGYRAFAGALDFHHINPKEKTLAISAANSSSWAATLRETRKCIVLCANCHRVRHHAPR